MQILQLAEDESWDKLLELDELSRELKAERVLVGFTSLRPTFPPTFKRYRGKGIKAYYHSRRASARSPGINRRYSSQLGGGKEPNVRSLMVHGMGQSMRRVLHSTSIPHIGLRSRINNNNKDVDGVKASSQAVHQEVSLHHHQPPATHHGSGNEEDERFTDIVKREEPSHHNDPEMLGHHKQPLEDSCGASSVQSEQPVLSVSKESNDASAFDTHEYSGNNSFVITLISIL